MSTDYIFISVHGYKVVVLDICFEYLFWISVLNICFEYLFWISVLDICFGYLFWISVLNICFGYLFWISVSDICFGYLFRISVLDICFGYLLPILNNSSNEIMSFQILTCYRRVKGSKDLIGPRFQVRKSDIVRRASSLRIVKYNFFI